MTDLEYMFTTRFARDEMIKKVNSNIRTFNETISIAISDKEPQGWRAAWMLNHSSKKKDQRLIEHTDSLIAAIKNKKDGHQRELVKLISKIELNEDQEGLLFDVCMNIWETPSKSPSVRSFAFQFIVSLVKKYPELKQEIDFLTQPEYLESLSPGIRKGLEKRVKEIL
jgi:hypothetical protein